MCKLFIVAILLSLGLSSYGQAYQPTFRVAITNPSHVPDVITNPDGTLNVLFQDGSINQIFNNYDVFTFEKEFFLFQDHPVLKDIYYVVCDDITLMADLQAQNYFSLIEELPEGEILNGGCGTPDDLDTNHIHSAPFRHVNMPEAWDITCGSPAVKIGVIDTDLHSISDPIMDDLRCKIEYLDCNGPNCGTLPSTAFSHGFAVASHACAQPNNGIKAHARIGAGAGYNSQLYFSNHPFGLWTTTAQRMVSEGVKVINMSFYTRCSTGSALEQTFIDEITAKGVVVVAAAGNGQLHCGPTNSVHQYLYPASYENVISVTAVPGYTYFTTLTNADQMFWQGTTLTHNDKVDIISIGAATSFASPVIAGVVALIKSVNPNLKTPDIIDLLQTTGVNITSEIYISGGTSHTNSIYFNDNIALHDQFKLDSAVTRLNAEAAVQEALNLFTTTPPVSTGILTKETTGVQVTDNFGGSIGGSFSYVDYDDDSDIDLHHLTDVVGEKHVTYQNNGASAVSFSNVAFPGLTTNVGGESIVGWADIDNDGDKDLVTRSGADFYAASTLHWYRNNGNLSFTKFDLFTTTFGPNQGRGGTTLADFNEDGNIDMLVGFNSTSPIPIRTAQIYTGDGTGGFTLVADPNAGTPNFINIIQNVRAFSVGDMDNDGDLDIVSTAYGPRARLFINEGSFNFREVVLPLSAHNALSRGASLVDYDNDLDLDIYLSAQAGGNKPIILNNLGNEKFMVIDDLAFSENIGTSNGRDTWGDYDNDGDMDLYHHTLTNKALYINHGNGVYFEKADGIEPTNDVLEASRESVQAAFADGNCDGFLDLYVGNSFLANNRNYYYSNDANNGNSSLIIKLESINGFGSAEGAKIIASTDLCSQMKEVNTNDGSPHEIHFGFGTYTGTISLKVEWPSGLIENLSVLLDQVNERIKIKEGQGIIDSACDCNPTVPSTGPEVSGTIGFDNNQDCDCDDDGDGAVDIPMNNVWVQVQEDLGGNTLGQSFYAQTDANGDYSINLNAGDYVVSPLIVSPMENSDDCTGNPNNLPPNSIDITNGPSSGNDFCLTTDSCDYDITLFAQYNGVDYTTPCTNVEQMYCVYFENNGVPLTYPTLSILLDPGTTYIPGSVTTTCGDTANISVSTGFFTGLTTVTYVPPVFNPGQSCTICFSVMVNQVLNGNIVTTASLSPGNGPCSGSVYETLNETVLCAFDPNDKLLVSPESCGPENNIHMDDELVYRIRFQNEGNAPAINIMLNDQLDEDLDFTTMNILSSSHTVTNSFLLPDNQLIFEFDQIHLPYKDLDPVGSQGYIIFVIKPKNNLPEGTVINNVASIYFDLNEAVVTNTTTNTLRTYPSPIVEFEANRSCTSLDISYDFNYTGVTPDGATYFWGFGAGATPSTSSSASPTDIVFDSEGDKQITLTITRYGCTESLTQTINVTSPVGCNGKENRVLMCVNGNEVCVPVNAALNMLATGNFCVGECDDNNAERKKNPTETIQVNSLIYPNPTGEKFINIQLANYGENGATAEVYSVEGQILLSTKLVSNSINRVELGDFAPGAYSVRLISDSRVEIIRFVKN